jgi:hypothetical protein
MDAFHQQHKDQDSQGKIIMLGPSINVEKVDR